MDDFVGKYLSLNCGTLGVYQGRITQVTPSHLQLDEACCNGIPHSGILDILVKNIKSLEIINEPSSAPVRPAYSPVSPRIMERPVPVRAPFGAEVRVSPRKFEGRNGREKLRLRRDEEAFGTPVDDMAEPDFDFEKNLALFDKKAVYDEINASKPDLVRQLEKNNYRWDEHVLEKQAARFNQIKLSGGDSMEYVTDSGLVVPSITIDVRTRLLKLAEDIGLSLEKQAELVGRAATETALHLLGGAHRLNPQNEHQCPNVAVLCGAHRCGVLATSASRQLASHGVRVQVYVDDNPTTSGADSRLFLKELSFLRHSGIIVTNHINDLKSTAFDLIIVALADSNTTSKGTSTEATKWAQMNRAPVMALDPPKSGFSGLTVKCSLVPALPLSLDATNGQIYLCNIGIPSAVFKSAGIDYLPPYGPKFVIPLHANSA